MKIVVHVDSAFDMLFFNRWLKKEQWEVLGLFYGPNLHPYTEYNRALLMQKLTSVLEDIIMMYPEYNFEDYLKGSAACATQVERCAYCYRTLLDYAASYAHTLEIPYFTTSLLLDPQHDQKLLRSIGEECAAKHQVKFFHQDLSSLMKEAEELANKMNVYRTPYCGCVYSERYRFYPTTAAAFDNERAGNVLTAPAKQKTSVSSKKK